MATVGTVWLLYGLYGYCRDCMATVGLYGYCRDCMATVGTLRLL